MSDNKKYYYLKLKDNFFDSTEIKILEGEDNGYLYSNILLKMYLKSLPGDGRMVVNDRIPYDANMIANTTGHNIDIVKVALQKFIELGLIEILSNGAIYMLDIQNFIGKSSTEAERIKTYRRKLKEEKQACLTSGKGDSYICTPELEIEIEKETELNKELDSKTYVQATPSRARSKPSTKPSQTKQFTSEFEEWYQGYPKKQGKANALKGYIKLRKNYTQEELFTSRDNYISEMTRKGTEDKYIMMASSFLGPKRQGYLDYLDGDNTESNLEAEKSKRECDNMRRILGLDAEPPQGEVIDAEVIPEREALPWR